MQEPKKCFRRFVLPSIVFLLGAWAGSALAQDVGGVWEVDLWTAYVRTSMVLRLQQDAETVTGTYDLRGSIGSYYDVPTKGTFKDGVLRLTMQFRTHQYIEATVREDTMQGIFMTSSANQLVAKRKK